MEIEKLKSTISKSFLPDLAFNPVPTFDAEIVSLSYSIMEWDCVVFP